MHQLVEVWQVALTLHPEYGTQPNVYYVPPLPSQAFDAEGRPTGEPRVPEDYLRQLFGPGVDAALATLQVEIAKKEAGANRP